MHQKIIPGDEKRWKKEIKERSEEWVKSLQKDTMLEETIFIANDIINQINDK